MDGTVVLNCKSKLMFLNTDLKTGEKCLIFSSLCSRAVRNCLVLTMMRYKCLRCQSHTLLHFLDCMECNNDV